jgi:hypothetical protein
MQRTSRAPPVVGSGRTDSNVVRLQRRNAAPAYESAALSAAEVETLGALMERASQAARQMRYFALAIRKFSFSELISSAERAGFIQPGGRSQGKEVLFRWYADEPDLIFSVSFRDPARASVVAESRGDIFGLMLTAYSQAETISVETNPLLGKSELGPNAALFRDLLLTFPDFDEMPAWTKFPERHAQHAGSFARFRDRGMSAACAALGRWGWISSRALGAWAILQDRWDRSR